MPKYWRRTSERSERAATHQKKSLSAYALNDIFLKMLHTSVVCAALVIHKGVCVHCVYDPNMLHNDKGKKTQIVFCSASLVSCMCVYVYLFIVLGIMPNYMSELHVYCIVFGLLMDMSHNQTHTLRLQRVCS